MSELDNFHFLQLAIPVGYDKSILTYHMEMFLTNPQMLYAHPDELRANPWNSNTLTPENEAKLDQSLARLKSFKPLTVRTVPDVPGYEILGGEHRWESLKRLGHEQIALFNVGDVDDKTAKEITLADNYRWGTDDGLLLADLLKGLDLGFLEEMLPTGATDLQHVLTNADISLDALDIDENFDKNVESPEEEIVVEPKAPKTHTQIRFLVPIKDAEKITKLVAQVRKDYGFTTQNDLTNAGDALVQLLLAPVHKSILTDVSSIQTMAEIEQALDALDDMDDETTSA